jgi:heme-degrading monooxygenase HmoA
MGRARTMNEAKWASGRWQVKDGQVAEFVQRWKDWLDSSTKGIAGFQWARLLRSKDDPLRFNSFSAWGDDASLKAWKTSSSFEQGLASVRELCDEFVGGDFDAVAELTA